MQILNMQRKEGMAIVISNKVDFRAKKVTKTREGHYAVMERSFQQEDKAILNVYSQKQNYKACEARTERIERRIEESTIPFGDCISLSQPLIV